MIIGERGTLERNAQQRSPVRRERRRKDGIAFDDAGIAVGGALTRPAAVDERNRDPPFDEMDRDGRADDAGSEHDDVGARHESSLHSSSAIWGRFRQPASARLSKPVYSRIPRVAEPGPAC